MAAPFVYIAALRRSGSNLLCEALSGLPDAYVFREPGIARGQFRLKRSDAERFADIGCDLRAIRKGRPRSSAELIVHFRDRIWPALLAHVGQIGIKEINHAGGERLLEAMPRARVVVTGRDPRDVYLSLHHKREARGIAFQGELTPDGVSEEIRRTFADQRAIGERFGAHWLRYEDLCTDPSTRKALLDYVESPLLEPGSIGEINRFNRRVHGTTVSDRHVGRWRSEPDEALRREAEETFERLPEYADFWEYPR